MAKKDTDISKNQNITTQEIAPYVDSPNVSRVGAIDSSNTFNTFTNFIGLGANIIADVNKNTALSDTGDEVLGVIDEYKETSPTSILEAQDQIALRNTQRVEKQSKMGYNVTNETPTLLLEGIDKENQSFLVDIEKDISFITRAKSQKRMTEIEAETRINDLYRKKLKQYPYLAGEILQHGARVRDLYGFNNLLKQDNAILKDMQDSADKASKNVLDEEKRLKQEMKELSIPEIDAITDLTDGSSIFNINIARQLIDHQRNVIFDHKAAKRESEKVGFDKEKLLNNIPYKVLNSQFDFNVNQFDINVKQTIATAFAGEDGILNTKDDTEITPEIRASLATNLESLRVATISRITKDYAPYRMGVQNDRFDKGYDQMIQSITDITKNYSDAVSKKTLAGISTNISTIISAANENAVFNKFGSKVSLAKAIKEFLPQPEMMDYIEKYYTDESASPDPNKAAMGKLGLKSFNNMIKNFVKSTALNLEDAKDSFSPRELKETNLPVDDKLQEMLLYTIENNTSAPGDTIPMIDKYLNSIENKNNSRQENVNTSFQLISVLSNGTLTESRVKKLKDDGRLVQVIDDTYKITIAGLKDYILKTSDITITENDDSSLSSTDSNLNNSYLKPLNNIYKINKIFSGEKIAKQRLSELLNSLETPEVENSQPTFEDASSKNNLGNIKNPNDLSKFQEFKTRDEGIIASANLLTRLATGKHKNHIGKNINTVKGIIDIWRPDSDQKGPGDISQKDYIKLVSDAVGVNSTDKIDLSNKNTMAKFLEALFKVEGNTASLQEILGVLNK